MDLKEKYLAIEVPGLDDFPSSKQSLFCGIAKLVYLRMYRDHHGAGLDELRKELLQELKNHGDDKGTVAMRELISSI